MAEWPGPVTAVADLTTCPRCGCEPANLRPPGTELVVRDTDLRGLTGLLDGSVDQDRCALCTGYLPVAPTVYVVFPHAAVLYAPGPLLDAAGDPPEGRDWKLVPDGSHAAPRVVRFADLDALRQAVRDAACRQVPDPHPVPSGPAENGGELTRCWRELPPRRMVALALCAAGLLRVPDAACHPAPDRLQVRVWRAMAADWTAIILGPGTPDARLQDDLDNYVVGESIAGDPLDLLNRLSDEPPAAGPAGAAPYVWRAIQGALARSLGRPNPGAAAWAQDYFAHEVTCALRPGGPTPGMRSARVSAEFAVATVGYQVAWDAAAAMLHLFDPADRDPRLSDRGLSDVAAAVGAAATRAGHPQLLHAVLEARLVSSSDGSADPSDIAAEALAVADRHGWEAALAATGAHLDRQPTERRDAATDAVGAALVAAAGAAALPRVLVWWTRRLLRGGRVADAGDLLARHGFDGDQHDDRLDVVVRARLWGARAATLMGAGRPEAALGLWRHVVELIDRHPHELAEAPGLRAWALVNLSDALDATGAVDEAFDLLTGIVAEPAGYGADPGLLVRLARLAVRFGDGDRAVELLAEAERLAGPGAVADRYAMLRAQQLMALGRHDAAVPVLLRLTEREPADDDNAMLLAEGAAWAMLTARGTTLPARATARAARLPRLLVERAERAARAGQRVDQVALLTRSAEMVRSSGADAGPLWQLVVTARRRHGLGDDPELLVRAASARLDAGDLPGMRDLLSAVPAALTAHYGSVSDVGLLAGESRTLLAPLAELAGGLLHGAGPRVDDVRLVGDLQRDAVGQARSARLRRTPDRLPRWSGAVRPRVPADAQPVAVLEWIRTGAQSLCCLLTRLADGDEQVGLLRLPAIDPGPLGRRLRHLLNEWSAGGPGSPLDVPGWAELSAGLVAELARHLQPGDHLVILHSPVYDLPWQLAVRDRWTVSFAAGWAQLLDLLGRPPTRPTSLGTCVVPRAREEPGTVTALDRSARLAERAGRSAGLRVRPRPDRWCDRPGLAALLVDVDLAVLLCHGAELTRSKEIGWALAHNGEPPPADTVTLWKAIGEHFFGWRDCLDLSRAARVVVSAACASARAYSVGLGDRLGLFSALRHAGTAAMVAPAWNVVADEALPLVDGTLARYLDGAALGEALRAACASAADSTPPWQAWSLALEGDWR